MGTLLAHVQLRANPLPQVRFLYVDFQLLCPTPIAVPGVVVAKVPLQLTRKADR